MEAMGLMETGAGAAAMARSDSADRRKCGLGAIGKCRDDEANQQADGLQRVGAVPGSTRQPYDRLNIYAEIYGEPAGHGNNMLSDH